MVFDHYVEYLEQEGALKRIEEYLCTAEYEVRKDAVYGRVSAKILDTVRKAGYDFVRYSDIAFGEKDKAVADDILNILLEEKRIVKSFR